MGKTLFDKERDISRVIDTLKSKILKLKMNRKQKSSSSRAKKLGDSLNYSTLIVDELDQDDYYISLNFKILRETL